MIDKIALHVCSGDSVFRAVIHPAAFKQKKGKNDAFDYSRMIHLATDASNPRLFRTSVAWQTLAPTIDHVHEYGCRTAEQRTIRNPNRPATYCGSYRMAARDVRVISKTEGLPEVSEADVIHVIEDGEIAHCNLEFRVSADVEEADIDGVKTAIIDQLWRKHCGPIRHVCEKDIGREDHPNETLSDGPGGGYKETRPALKRTFDHAIYYIVRKCLGVCRKNETCGFSEKSNH